LQHTVVSLEAVSSEAASRVVPFGQSAIRHVGGCGVVVVVVVPKTETPVLTP